MAARQVDVTHVGSLPRGEELTALLLAKDHGKPYDAAAFETVVQGAIDDAVARQVAAGVTIVSDGELGKVGYSTYVTERLEGFGGNVERNPALDLAAHPALAKKLAAIMGRQEFVRAACIGPVRLKTLEPMRDGAVVRLTHGPSSSGCLPSVDPMLASAGAVFGEGALGVVLTGMGRDGVEGASRLVASGGSILAQDQASCAVWGMPRAVLEAGLACAVLPPEKIARRIMARTEEQSQCS